MLASSMIKIKAYKDWKKKNLTHWETAHRHIYKQCFRILILYALIVFSLHCLGYIETSYRGARLFQYPLNYVTAITVGMCIFCYASAIIILLINFLREPIVIDKSYWTKNIYINLAINAFETSMLFFIANVMMWMFFSALQTDQSLSGRIITLICATGLNIAALKYTIRFVIPFYTKHDKAPTREKIY